MASQTGPMPAAGYKTNNMQEIKSHSSILYNERMAILFYLLDMHSIELNSSFTVEELLRVRGILKQIYKNIRTLIRNNPTMRATMNLDTQSEGTYVTDIGFAVVDNMVMWCEGNGYTTKKIYIVTQELNKVEMVLKDILQYYHYFVRPDFRQKPDIELATEKYKEMADERTVDELRELVGKRHSVDFENLGTHKVELDEIDIDDEEDEQPMEGFDKKRDLDPNEDEEYDVQ